jgi:hypothetical protein
MKFKKADLFLISKIVTKCPLEMKSVVFMTDISFVYVIILGVTRNPQTFADRVQPHTYKVVHHFIYIHSQFECGLIL